MSRTSRRVSRPLIALLAIVIALGVYFTVHKVRRTHADQPRVAQAPTDRAAKAPEPAPQSTAPATQPVTEAPNPDESLTDADKSPSTTQPADLLRVDAPDTTALITQTPTERLTAPADHFSQTSPMPVVESSAPRSNNSFAAARASDAPAPQGADGTTSKPRDATPMVSAPNLGDVKSKIDSGDLLAARQTLNDALISGTLSDSDADSVKKQIEQINQTVVFSPRRFPEDPWGGTYQVESGERLGTIAAKNSCSWELLARVNNITPKKLRSGQYIKIFKGPFHAVVYKHQFKMELYLGAPGGPGSMFIRSYPVGLGKDNSTPTGLWRCKAGDKIRNPRYYPPRGGDIIAPDDPKNPLGGYWIALEGMEGQALGKESYGVHGTIDPNSIGKMESMGCIRLSAQDISWVFDLLVDGKSKVLVKD